jgi:hypothetical protein
MKTPVVQCSLETAFEYEYTAQHPTDQHYLLGCDSLEVLKKAIKARKWHHSWITTKDNYQLSYFPRYKNENVQ